MLGWRKIITCQNDVKLGHAKNHVKLEQYPDDVKLWHDRMT